MKHLFAVLVLLLGGMTTIARAANDNPAPPDDAMWTICCRSYTGDGRVALANRARDAAKKLTGWKDWFVIYQEDEATLFYGYYKAPPYRDMVGGDPKEADRARADLKKVKSLRDDQNNPVFALSYFCEIPRPGSEGPREWDIRNTPPDRYWSLIIGEYRDNPDRKKVAVQAVRDLRNEKVEAYYLHGPVSSLVCVGAWPRKALKEQETNTAAEPDDPNTIVKVYNIPLPKNAVTDYYDKEGKHYKIFAPKVEIADPGMRAAVDANPYFATNGEVLGKRAKDRNGKERVVPNPSQLLIIPHKGDAFDNGEGNDKDKPADQPPPQVLRQLAPKPKQEPGTGKLKSLD